MGSPDQPHQHPGELIRIANSNSQAPPGKTESENLVVGPGMCVLEPPGGSPALWVDSHPSGYSEEHSSLRYLSFQGIGLVFGVDTTGLLRGTGQGMNLEGP